MAKKIAKKVAQKEEAPFDFNNYHFEVKNPHKMTQKQKEVLKVSQDPNTKMIILDGFPGTSKTYLSILIALEKLRDKRVSGITSFRSTIQAKDGETGFLSGDLTEKMRFFANPFYSKMQELLKDSDLEIISKKLFDFLPTSFVRSISLKNECLILSEAQNCFDSTIFDVCCRAGEGSFVIIEGDSVMQNDLQNSRYHSGFKSFCKMVDDEDSKAFGIHYFYFNENDIVRSDLVKYLVLKKIQFEME